MADRRISSPGKPIFGLFVTNDPPGPRSSKTCVGDVFFSRIPVEFDQWPQRRGTDLVDVRQENETKSTTMLEGRRGISCLPSGSFQEHGAEKGLRGREICFFSNHVAPETSTHTRDSWACARLSQSVNTDMHARRRTCDQDSRETKSPDQFEPMRAQTCRCGQPLQCRSS